MFIALSLYLLIVVKTRRNLLDSPGFLMRKKRDITNDIPSQQQNNGHPLNVLFQNFVSNDDGNKQHQYTQQPR